MDDVICWEPRGSIHFQPRQSLTLRPCLSSKQIFAAHLCHAMLVCANYRQSMHPVKAYEKHWNHVVGKYSKILFESRLRIHWRDVLFGKITQSQSLVGLDAVKVWPWKLPMLPDTSFFGDLPSFTGWTTRKTRRSWGTRSKLCFLLRPLRFHRGNFHLLLLLLRLLMLGSIERYLLKLNQGKIRWNYHISIMKCWWKIFVCQDIYRDEDIMMWGNKTHTHTHTPNNRDPRFWQHQSEILVLSLHGTWLMLGVNTEDSIRVKNR